MDINLIKKRFNLVFTAEELKRILIEDTDNGILIAVDLHEMHCNDAQRFLTNIINLNINTHFILLIIHGYVHGTKIKALLWNNNEWLSPRVKGEKTAYGNMGATLMDVSA